MGRVRATAVAVLPAVLAAAVYAALWLGQRQGWVWLTAVDSSSLQVLHDVGIKHPLWVRCWNVVCIVISPTTFRLLGVAAVLIAVCKRRLRAVLFLLVSIQSSELITWSAKRLAGRPRPRTALVHASASSFPSGHALAATVGVLALLTVLVPMASRSVGVVAAVVGGLTVLAVGFGRVALNVHHPSDVVAGWALGYLYFALCARLSGVSGSGRRRRQPGDRGQGCGGLRPVCPPRA